jgi:UDP-glucose:(heptosyl)LPS alpha-1,3-glucosyltransferase
MKIALVIDHFDPRRGGGESYTVSLGRVLVRSGHEVHVFAHTWAEVGEGIRFHRLPLISYPRWAKSLSLALSAYQALRSKDFDVVQGFGRVPCVDVHRPGGGAEPAWLIQDIRSRERGFDRLVTTLRRMLSLKAVVNILIERVLYGASDFPKVVSNSQKVKKDILRFYRRMDPSKIRVIYNGVDVDRFHPRNKGRLGQGVRRTFGLAEDTVAILFMAHNFRLKGLHCLLRSIEGIRKEAGNWVLFVAGKGRKAPFKRFAKICGIGDRILFLDRVGIPEAILGASDILVHPTFYDPFSNVCLEAMASGVPLITTSHNGAGEIIQDGVSGYVIPDPRCVDLLGQRILALSMNSQERERVGYEARGIAEKFSWNRHLCEMEALYKEILEGHKR